MRRSAFFKLTAKKTKFTILFFIFLYGCSSLIQKREFIVSTNLYGLKNSAVAVLPFDNASTDITAEDFLRELVIKKLIAKGWAVISKEVVDEKLKEMGISDGGQLGAFKYQELGSKLGARILCYGYIENFRFQNLGYIVVKDVSLDLKFIDAMSGEVLFEGTGKGRGSEIHTNKEEAKKAFVEGNIVKLVGNVLKKPLAKESNEAVDELFRKFP